MIYITQRGRHKYDFWWEENLNHNFDGYFGVVKVSDSKLSRLLKKGIVKRVNNRLIAD